MLIPKEKFETALKKKKEWDAFVQEALAPRAYEPNLEKTLIKVNKLLTGIGIAVDSIDAHLDMHIKVSNQYVEDYEEYDEFIVALAPTEFDSKQQIPYLVTKFYEKDSYEYLMWTYPWDGVPLEQVIANIAEYFSENQRNYEWDISIKKCEFTGW